ncbi:MAG: hypothetical protein ACRBFS_26205 [Aureispira sp.]
MPKSAPLDQPLNQTPVVVRRSYSSVLELIIGLTNLAFLILFTVTAIIGTMEDGFTLFLFVPYVFALVISLSIPLFLWDWRKAALAYGVTGKIKVFEKTTANLPIMMAGIACFFWGIYLAFLIYNLCFSEVESWQLTRNYLLLMLPGFILGPFQFLYLRHLNKIRDAVLNYHKNNT